ncbi:MAG: cobalamin ABC transporter substrate-binding protein [Labilithrix sp.]|nr:cobalamin ABC transporter substrate-binding protein [Labilithrix sp.]
MRVSWPRQARPFGLVGTTIAAGLLAASAGVGCGGTQDPNDPSRPVIAYAGRQADLFDDTIEPAAVGLDFEKGYSPRLDKALRERTQVGDAVLRVRVSTVTAKTDGPDVTYQLGLHTVEKLAGKHPPPENFTVQLDKSSESLGIMKNFESRMVGYAFVAFVREFSHPSGDRELHFHLAPDTKDVKAAVGDAMLLGELK